MRGEIISFDAVTGMGLVSGEDGQRYTFDRSGFSGLGVPRAGQRIDFVPTGDIATNIMALGGEVPGAATVAAPTPGGGIDWQPLFLSFDGRIRRSHFWAAWGIIFAANIVLSFIPILGSLISLVLIWPSIGIQVKRLHDMGKTGWLVLAPFVLSVVLAIVAVGMIGFSAMSTGTTDFENDPAAAMAIMGPAAGIFLLLILVNLGFLIWIGATPGTPGENRYGPDPKGGVSVDTFS